MAHFLSKIYYHPIHHHEFVKIFDFIYYYYRLNLYYFNINSIQLIPFYLTSIRFIEENLLKTL